MIEHEGKNYARVSEILQPFNNFSKVSPQWLEYRAHIGTQVHLGILKHLQDEFPVLGKEEMPYFNSFLKWKGFLEPQFLWMERRFFNEEKMITGCIDALVKIPGDSHYTIVDYKTGASESHTWIMQAHLYHFLVSQEDTPLSKRCLFLKLHPLGSSPVVLEYKICKNVMAKCMKAVEDFWKNQENNSHI